MLCHTLAIQLLQVLCEVSIYTQQHSSSACIWGIYPSVDTIFQFVVPIRISLIEGCCSQESYQRFLLARLKSSLRKFYGRHHDLVDRYAISVSVCNQINTVMQQLLTLRCPVVLFLLGVSLSVFRFTDSYYPFDIFKLFLEKWNGYI